MGLMALYGRVWPGNTDLVRYSPVTLT